MHQISRINLWRFEGSDPNISESIGKGINRHECKEKTE
jgi:hypothetical protein